MTRLNSGGSGTPATMRAWGSSSIRRVASEGEGRHGRMEEDGVGLVRMGRRRECVRSEIEIEEREGWRGMEWKGWSRRTHVERGHSAGDDVVARI